MEWKGGMEWKPTHCLEMDVDRNMEKPGMERAQRTERRTFIAALGGTPAIRTGAIPYLIDWWCERDGVKPGQVAQPQRQYLGPVTVGGQTAAATTTCPARWRKSRLLDPVFASEHAAGPSGTGGVSRRGV